MIWGSCRCLQGLCEEKAPLQIGRYFVVSTADMSFSHKKGPGEVHHFESGQTSDKAPAVKSAVAPKDFFATLSIVHHKIFMEMGIREVG